MSCSTPRKTDIMSLRKKPHLKFEKKENSSDEEEKTEKDPLAGLKLDDALPPVYKPHRPGHDRTQMGERGENPIVWLEVQSFGGGRGRGGGVTIPRNLGKLHFELRNDLVPVACANFLTLITGKIGWGQDGVNYHYANSRLHRILKGVLWEAGDLLDQRGNCSRSIYNKGGLFQDENFILRHTGPGCLSMCNRGADTNGSLFQVTFQAIPEFDNKFVVFGCLADDESYRTLSRINTFGTDHGMPTEEVRITDCGVAYPYPVSAEEKEKAEARRLKEIQDKIDEKKRMAALAKARNSGA